MSNFHSLCTRIPKQYSIVARAFISSNARRLVVGITRHITKFACRNGIVIGADADHPGGTYFEGGKLNPHVYTKYLTALGLDNDGTNYSKVRRITRYVRR